MPEEHSCISSVSSWYQIFSPEACRSFQLLVVLRKGAKQPILLVAYLSQTPFYLIVHHTAGNLESSVKNILKSDFIWDRIIQRLFLPLLVSGVSSASVAKFERMVQ